MGKKSIMKDLTLGIFGSLADLLLWYTYLVGSSFGKSGTRGVYQAFYQADKMLEKFNHSTIASIWHSLKKKKLLTYQKRKNLFNPIITDFGRKRLKEILPIYHEKRPWDNKIYLIAYDIPENNHIKRNRLRKFLKDMNCKILQESIWLTPYNIRELLSEFIDQKKIPGIIVVSDIGKDGGIGETSIHDLIVNLYNLEKLDEKYEIFINKVNNKDTQIINLIFEYLSILKNDPQLPFELLPEKFTGSKANLLYQKLEVEYILSFIRPDRK